MWRGQRDASQSIASGGSEEDRAARSWRKELEALTKDMERIGDPDVIQKRFEALVNRAPLDKFNFITIVRALYSTATIYMRMRIDHEKTLRYALSFGQRVIDLDPSQVRYFNSQDLENSIKALGRLEIGKEGPFVQMWLKRAQEILDGFESQHLASSIYALACLRVSGDALDEFVQRWLVVAQARLEEFTPQDLSGSVWALRKLEIKSVERFVQAWVQESQKKLDKFDSQELSPALYALACLDVSYEVLDEFVQRWVVVAQEKLEDFNAQNLSNSIWALVKLEVSGDALDEFVQRWVVVAQEKLEDFTPEEIRQVVDAGTRLNDSRIKSLVMLSKRSVAVEALDSVDDGAVPGVEGRSREEDVQPVMTTKELMIEEDGRTELARAVSKGQCDAIRALKEAGADFNQIDGEGDTPLTAVVKAGIVNKVEVVRLLIECGTYPDRSNRNGAKPITLAIKRREKALRQKLKRKGINPEAKGEDGRTELARAIDSDPGDIVRMLLSAIALQEQHRLGREEAGAAPGEESDEKETTCGMCLVKYANPLINYEYEGQRLFLEAKRIGGMKLIDTLLALGEDKSCAEDLIRAIKQKGMTETLYTLMSVDVVAAVVTVTTATGAKVPVYDVVVDKSTGMVLEMKHTTKNDPTTLHLITGASDMLPFHGGYHRKDPFDPFDPGDGPWGGGGGSGDGDNGMSLDPKGGMMDLSGGASNQTNKRLNIEEKWEDDIN